MIKTKLIINPFSSLYTFVECQSESTVEGEQPQTDSSLMAEKVIAVLEKNGVKIIGAARGKAKKGAKPKMASMRIDIPPSTPTRTIVAVTSVVSSVWEDLINGSRKDGTTGGSYINNKKIQCAEKMIRGAFVELYRGLGLIKKYRYFDNIAPNNLWMLLLGLRILHKCDPLISLVMSFLEKKKN